MQKSCCVSCSDCSVTEVVWETDGVEEIPEGKPALVPGKVSAPPERYFLLLCCGFKKFCSAGDLQI